MSEPESNSGKGAAAGLDEHAARRKGWGLAAFLKTLNVLTMTGPPGETNLHKRANEAIARKKALRLFRASGEPIQDVEVLVQGTRAALFQYPMKLNCCHVDVFSSGKELLEVVRLVGGRRKEVLLQCRLDEVPDQGLVLPEEYPNKQRLVLEIERIVDGKYQVKVALDTTGEPATVVETETHQPRTRSASSMRTGMPIRNIIGGMSSLAMRPIHTVGSALLIVILGTNPMTGGSPLPAASNGAPPQPASRPADPTGSAMNMPAAPAARATANDTSTNVPPDKTAAKPATVARGDARGGARERAKDNGRQIKWGGLVQLKLASVKRLAVRVDERSKKDEELNRSLRKSFTDLLQKSGVVAVVDDGRAGDYDAVLTLHYESVNDSHYDAAALFASLVDAAEKNLRQYIEDCSSSAESSGKAELQNASAKLVDTLVADLENARKSFRAAETTAGNPPSGF